MCFQVSIFEPIGKSNYDIIRYVIRCRTSKCSVAEARRNEMGKVLMTIDFNNEVKLRWCNKTTKNVYEYSDEEIIEFREEYVDQFIFEMNNACAN